MANNKHVHTCKHCGHRDGMHKIVSLSPFRRGACMICDCACYDERIPDTDDITRNIHGGNARSEQANLRCEPLKDSLAQLIWQTVRKLGDATLTEICDQLKRDYPMDGRTGKFDKHKVSPRISELKRAEMLDELPDEYRDGCAVLVTKSLFNPRTFKQSRIGKTAAAGGAQ